MKQPPKNDNRTSRAAQFAVAATVAAVPLVTLSTTASAQRGAKEEVTTSSARQFVLPHVLEKSGLRCTIVGVEDGHTIYKSSDDKLFYLDPKTGDQRYIKYHTIKLTNASLKTSNWIKLKSEVSILGVDAEGNSIQQNDKGEKFYLDAATGDMVFVK